MKDGNYRQAVDIDNNKTSVYDDEMTFMNKSLSQVKRPF